jgi:DNA-binding LytR/AlgR family response regulator
MLKIAICEDSEIFVEIIKKNIETILKVPYELHPFLSGKEFMTSLPEMGCPYDIVFLDISLGEETVSGIELGQIINGENPRTQLIFISQYLEYASDVYSTKHTYFIYKNRLNEYLPAALDAALKNLQTDKEPFLTVKIKQSHHRIPVNDILFLERNLRETFIYTKSETYTVRDKLNMICSLLSRQEK